MCIYGKTREHKKGGRWSTKKTLKLLASGRESQGGIENFSGGHFTM